MELTTCSARTCTFYFFSLHSFYAQAHDLHTDIDTGRFFTLRPSLSELTYDIPALLSVFSNEIDKMYLADLKPYPIRSPHEIH